ncbi:MAG: hypothetical protein LUH09_06875, partial [Clostridiales bacterium]|nr:hypothetical protein [Clostridiales bacterium]
MLTNDQLNTIMQTAVEASWRLKPAAEVKEKVLTGALRGYASGAEREEVFAIYDTTLFGSGKTGFLLTSEALYHDSFPYLLKGKGTTTRLPLAGLRGIRALPNDKLNFNVSYQDGSKITIYVSTVHQDGLRALVKAVASLEEQTAPRTVEPEPIPEPEPA